MTIENPNILLLDKDNFREATLSHKILLVEFMFDNCPYCKSVENIVQEIANENVGKIKVAKLDVLKGGDLSMIYEAKYLPTFLIFKDGKNVGRANLPLTKEQLLTKILNHI
jgi:thioredoxin 1